MRPLPGRARGRCWDGSAPPGYVPRTEAREAFSIGDERVWKHLERDVALELVVLRAIHQAHTTRAEGCDDGI